MRIDLHERIKVTRPDLNIELGIVMEIVPGDPKTYYVYEQDGTEHIIVGEEGVERVPTYDPNNFTEVRFPIRVPRGNFCWTINNTICEHLDNEGGHATCTLGMGDPIPYGFATHRNPMSKYGMGYKKPDDCKRLEVINDSENE